MRGEASGKRKHILKPYPQNIPPPTFWICNMYVCNALFGWLFLNKITSINNNAFPIIGCFFSGCHFQDHFKNNFLNNYVYIVFHLPKEEH